MNSNIFIPKKINVGYQKRYDTYTGKLAYIIYYDEKGKLRKETSWNSWRDEKIPNEEFDNVPTSGFVLNKHAGGVENSWSWNTRKSYCRVYDPRNFEFEITIENLLYILENTSAIKGKGLEGEFVYGWDGKDLILMPVESPDYKQISEYNNILYNNEHIKAKDLITGATYLTKDNTELIYVGKFEYYSHGYEWRENGEIKRSKKWKDVPRVDGYSRYSSRVTYDYIQNLPYGNYFWFAYKSYDYEYVGGEKVTKATYKWSFEQFKSIPKGKLIKCLDGNCSSEYADICEAMEGCYTYSPYDCSKDKFFDVSLEDFVSRARKRIREKDFYDDFEFVSNVNGSKKIFKAVPISHKENKYILKRQANGVRGKRYYDYVDDIDIFPTEVVELEKSVGMGYYAQKKIAEENRMIPVTIEEMYEVMKPLYRQKYLKNGREYERVWSIE